MVEFIWLWFSTWLSNRPSGWSPVGQMALLLVKAPQELILLHLCLLSHLHTRRFVIRLQLDCPWLQNATSLNLGSSNVATDNLFQLTELFHQIIFLISFQFYGAFDHTVWLNIWAFDWGEQPWTLPQLYSGFVEQLQDSNTLLGFLLVAREAKAAPRAPRASVAWWKCCSIWCQSAPASVQPASAISTRVWTALSFFLAVVLDLK